MEKSAGTGNEPAARIQSTSPQKAKNLASIFQDLSPDPYKGKRVQFTALVKTERAADGASLWMTSEDSDDIDAFDDMSDRPISGTKDWTECSTVLNIPSESKRVRVGFILRGNGTAWMKDFHVKIVGSSVKTTELPFDPKKFSLHELALKPKNLDFIDSRQTDTLHLNQWSIGEHSGSIVSLAGSQAYNGKPSICIGSDDEKGLALGSIHQSFSTKYYLKKRLKFSAYVKTSNVKDWSGLFMQMDGGGKVLAFDAMEDRPVKGNTDWHKVEIVLDVPTGSKRIKIGFMLAGQGNACISGCALDEVDTSVLTTGNGQVNDLLPSPYLEKQPENSFE